MSYRGEHYVNPCHCKGAERNLVYPLEQYADDPKVTEIVNSYLDFRYKSASSIATRYSLGGLTLITGCAIYGGVSLMAATAIVSTPIALVAYGFFYLLDRPRQWDNDLAVFLAHEKLKKDVTTTNENVLSYIKTERLKFYSYPCSWCADKDY